MPLAPAPTSDNSSATELSSRRQRTRLIVGVRTQILSAVVLFCIASGLLLLNSDSSFHLSVLQLSLLLGTLSTVSLYNLIYRFYYQSIEHLLYIDHIHILLDIIVITVLIHFTGGGSSWLWPLYLITTIEAAILLKNRRDVLGIGALNALFYGWALIAGYYDILPYIYRPITTETGNQDSIFLLLLWFWVSFINTTVAFICTFLMKALRRHSDAANRWANQLNNFLDNANDLIFSFSANGSLKYANQACKKALNLNKTDSQLNIHQLIDSNHLERWHEHLTDLENNGLFELGEFSLTPHQQQQQVHILGSVTQDKSEESILLWGIFLDVTENNKAQQQLDNLNNFDQLTNTANRNSFMERASQATLMAKRDKRNIGFAILNIDRFKMINDTLGTAIGDLVLQRFAHRLMQNVREVDVVGRLAGDEFIVMLVNVDSALIVDQLANNLSKVLAAPMQIDGHELFLTSSVGLSLFPHDNNDPEILIRMASLALYHVKTSGRNNIQFYTDSMDQKRDNHLQLLNALHHALDNDELEVFYQPKVNTQSGAINSVEALLRWHHPQLGQIMPNDFIPLAEESGLINVIGEWVLRQACRQSVAWKKAGLADIRVAVNVSGYQLQFHSFLATVTNILAETGLAPDLLELEVTETVVMQNPDSAHNILVAIQKLGVHMAIDDFGTGYSSLAHLKRLPISSLKIDRSFVIDIESNSQDAAIASAIIDMGKTLELNIIVEGVETSGQLHFFKERQCHEIQGFFYSAPVSADRLTDLLENGFKAQTS
ncbi:MAG: hypothetical protein B6I37_02120 [Desulfobacteraceae bacterium 4572_35.2]|nr:MAG: hypothetical protein B6I37_02120 [Desulfobacteraceae bacterium 4572_35.2]